MVHTAWLLVLLRGRGAMGLSAPILPGVCFSGIAQRDAGTSLFVLMGQTAGQSQGGAMASTRT
ncbi:hypothetical protein F5Y09DRAFT_308289, partial [Xylaria sp. FL1042]